MSKVSLEIPHRGVLGFFWAIFLLCCVDSQLFCLFLHMVPVLEISLASLRIPHTSLPPLGIYYERVI